VPPGSYSGAGRDRPHPLEGRDCAAPELLLDRDAAVERWVARVTGRGDDGYRVEIGVASPRRAGPFTAARRSGRSTPTSSSDGRALSARETVDGGSDGTIVLQPVRPAPTRRTWVALASAGRSPSSLTLGLSRSTFA
jgi:hypothetical protein